MYCITLKGVLSIAKEKIIALRVDEEFQKKIQAAAEKENRTISNYVLTVLKEKLQKEN